MFEEVFSWGVGAVMGGGGASAATYWWFRKTNIDYKKRWQASNELLTRHGHILTAGDETATLTWEVTTEPITVGKVEGTKIVITNGKKDVEVCRVSRVRSHAKQFTEGDEGEVIDLSKVPYADALKRGVAKAQDMAAEFNARGVR